MSDPRDPHLFAAPDESPIAPQAYAPPVAEPVSRPRVPRRKLLVGAVLAFALGFLWFLLGVRAVELHVLPSAADVDIHGGPQLRLGSHALLRPGAYTVRARAAGYQPLERPFAVDDTLDQHLELALQPLPGLLTLGTTPVVARVQVDGVHVGASNGAPLELAAGARAVRIEADRYLPQETTVEIQGRGITQALELALAPAFGSYRIETEPDGARVLLDGTELGRTPADVELLSGARSLRVVLDGYRDETIAVEARAGETRAIEKLVLSRADARLRIVTRPAGASITLDGVFQGAAPLDLALAAGSTRELIAFKAGYERSARTLRPQRGTQEIVLELRAQTGELRFTLQPADAEIWSGDRRLARGSATLALPATAQRLVVRREGYAARELVLTPRPGFAQDVPVTLQSAEQQRAASTPGRARTQDGQELVLLQPAPFYMGSSRREPGRRANELLHEVRPKRPFYLSLGEVTNAAFRGFRAAHSSGNFKGKSLNGDQQPAVNLGWNDAALYCNWLSEREGLKPFYRVSGKTAVGADAASTGYRLPTEAEWAWAAALKADGKPLRFTWGETLPPPAKVGNFADASGASLLGTVIAGYEDGFPVAAPIRSFAPNRLGLFDMDGNAAEWVHDLYEAAPHAGGDDPLGPDIGDYHVLRGASWRHGGLTELRLAYRDYGKDGRADVGFRIARYAR